MFLLRLSLERAANEAKFLEEFFVSLDFFFVTFFCIKTKESKDERRRRILMQFSEPTRMKLLSSSTPRIEPATLELRPAMGLDF
jgi:hypothetical protein